MTTGDIGLIWMKHKSKAYKYYLHFIYMSIYISLVMDGTVYVFGITG